MRTLLIDNYDSYTFNLFHLLGEVNGGEDQIVALEPDNIVISPGPGRPEHPRDAGVSLEVLRRAEVPVLGVCLGHEELAYAAGGTIEHAPEVMQGGLSPIRHDGSGLFAGLPQDFLAVRYHSLVVGVVPEELRVTAWTPDGVIMALEHRTRPLYGVQFHPESVSTRCGRALLVNFRDRTPRRGPVARTAGPAPAPDGPLGQVVRYDVTSRTVVVERASGREVRAESVFDHCRRELARLRVDAPDLPFDYIGGFVGYLGFELKADCGAPLVHPSPLPDAALLLCDRVIAFDHRERRVHL